ncbi:hypothetical protein VNO77_39878 [Canavalia gladiata]|uniref:Ribosomal protein L34Ae n=1 Tax=Canavalia gladiata TaxID=3824 RepID=A0AAN9JZ68_CANGL
MLKTHIDSINIVQVVNDIVCVNMLSAFGVICNYVLYVFGLVLRHIFRFLQLGDAKDKPIVQPLLQDHGIEKNQLFYSDEVDGFQEELADFLFWSEDFHERSEETEGETECSVFSMKNDTEESEKREEEGDCSVLNETPFDVQEQSMKTESSVSNEIRFDIHDEFVVRGIEEGGIVFMESDSANSIIDADSKENGGETKGLVSMETNSDVHDDGKKVDEDETKSSTFMKNGSDLHNDNMKRGEEEVEETKGDVLLEVDSNMFIDVKKIDENETGCSVLMENVCDINEDGLRIGEDETESSVLNEAESTVHADSMKREEKEEEIDGAVFVETDSVTTTNMCQYLSGKDISGFMEEPTTLRFSFREFYMGPDVSTVSDKAYANTEIIADKEFSEFGSEKEPIVQNQVSTPSSHVPLCFESETFGGTDSSDEDYFLYNENSLTSDSESESSSSSGLIWGNSNKMDDDSIAYQFLGGKNGGEGFESEILKLMMREEKQSSCDGKVSEFGVHDIYSKHGYVEMEPCRKGSKNEERECRNGLEKNVETRWEDELSESESDEDDLEWEHDDLVEQLKLELKNSRQGGLATIFEEEEEEVEEKEMEKEEETVSPKVVEDLRPLKIEEKLEYKDQIDEIEKVYKSYAEKMRKLDILNYQTMHALGLVQLKDPLKLISRPSQNLWPRKASKNTNDPLIKIVNELNRDLELVYVGQVCLSWEILCWQHKKALELQQHDSQGSHRYNHVAGEFQLFEVLVQRFIENEPFQGPRIQNYVKNRCVIRNLLQVPGIKDDDSKWNEEEDAIASGRLAEIIKESMRVFWEFVRADKDYGNVILKVSQQNKIDLKDPVISGFLVDIRTQLQKKERKLKDIVRSGNCIVKKFQKQQEDELDHEQLVAQEDRSGGTFLLAFSMLTPVNFFSNVEE